MTKAADMQSAAHHRNKLHTSAECLQQDECVRVYVCVLLGKNLCHFKEHFCKHHKAIKGNISKCDTDKQH